MEKSRTVLIVSAQHSAHLVSELPRIFKNRGFRVVVLGFPHYSLTYCSAIDEWIEAPSDLNQVLQIASKLVLNRAFEMIILAPDALLWALYDTKNGKLLEQLSPIGNPRYWHLLSGKIEVASLLKELNILSPPSKAACSSEEALNAAKELGYPVMLKISRSGGGNGVIRCDSPKHIIDAPFSYDRPILVEKFIEGELISVEPLFVSGKLRAYSYSKMTDLYGPYAPSLERYFLPCSDIESTLTLLGSTLNWTGFANMTFFFDSGKHYLFEIDFRPTRWIRQSELAQVNWSEALKDPSSPLQKPQISKTVRHFPADFYNALTSKDLSRTCYWLFNRNQCWKSIPKENPKLFLGAAIHLIKKALSI